MNYKYLNTDGPKCERIPNCEFQFGSYINDYIRGITNQWLLIAPKANPAMLEMFRDRNASPFRDMEVWAGEFAGKYLTSAVQTLRINNSSELRSWLKSFVEILISLQDDDGYLGPWPDNYKLTNVDQRERLVWDTWGHYHLMLGLCLWYEESCDQKALECACKIADLMCNKYLNPQDKRLVDTGWPEMNLAPAHSLAFLYKLTGKQTYLDLAIQIVDEFAAENQDGQIAGDYVRQALAGKEFFETPKPRWESLHPIMALAELYWITGNEDYKTAFEQIWWSIVKLDRHNNGGFSSGEKATGNPYHLDAIETCCTIAWNAMTIEMLKMTSNSLAADELELSLYNSITGMHSSTGRWACYDTPMNGVRRASAQSSVFQSREGSPELNCCSVNSPRGFGFLSEWAVMSIPNGIIINYYGESEISTSLPTGENLTVIQQTDYPFDGKIKLEIKLDKPTTTILKLRIPQWSEHTEMSVNNAQLDNVTSGKYTVIEREWQNGDIIDIQFDMSLHFWKGEKECKGLASIYYGPILLTYDLRYNLSNSFSTDPQTRDIEKWNPANCMIDIPELDIDSVEYKKINYDQWLPPQLLFEFVSSNGKKVRLCDFGSAGEAGTPYCSWLPFTKGPSSVEFSNLKPLRTCR